jgi:hypothetical protein
VSIEKTDLEKAQLRAGISRTRDALVDTAEELKDTVEANLHWRTWVARHPGLAMGLALGVGVWLGGRRR